MNSSQHGYISGGTPNTTLTGAISDIERITFTFNSGSSSSVGFLSAARFSTNSMNSLQHGFVLSGYNGSTELSTVDRLLFPFNSGTASAVGLVTIAGSAGGGIDNTDFVAMFV
jgi:hypothetical protein